MSTLRCRFCGLAHFAEQVICKQCKQPLKSDAEAVLNQSSGKPKFEPYEGGRVAAAQTLESDEDSPMEGAWRDGELLVMTSESVLPARCVKCNATAPELQERKLAWNPIVVNVIIAVSIFPLRSLLIFVVAIILAFFTRRTAKISVALCESHQQKRTFGVFVGGGLITTGLGLGLYVAFAGGYMLLPWALVILLVGAFVSVLLSGQLTAKKIEHPYIWVKGMDERFLDSMPMILE